MSENWVMDVSYESEPYCFCPIKNDGSIVVGMNVIADRSPGNLVGIFHTDGQGAAKNWEQKHLDWYEKYSQVERNPDD